MKEINVRLNFTWDDCDDLFECKMVVPEHITEDMVNEILINEHNFLCFEDEEDIYETEGRIPATLLNYVCNKYEWEWSDIEYDIDLNLD